MTTCFVRRILQTIPILFIISILLFLMVRSAPGGPLTAARRNSNITEEQLQKLEEQLGLNRPLPIQYVDWLGDMFSGDMGQSIKFRRPVSEMIGERISNYDFSIIFGSYGDQSPRKIGDYDMLIA